MIELPLPLRHGANLPAGLDDPALDTPAILVDLDIVDANIRQMAAFTERNGFVLRPHIKTHKSVKMAKRQIAAGAVGICTATVTEAEAMVGDDGIKDILIAYPLVGKRKFERLLPLLDRATITLAADSPELVQSYEDFAEQANRLLQVMLEIDTGMHRVGVTPAAALSLALKIAKSKHLLFRGIMTHAGQTHDVQTIADIAAIARAEAEIMGMVRAELEQAGLDVPCVSAGSTITAPYFRAGDAITEIRPGTYIYNDLRTLALSSCTPDSIAARVLATVVSVAGDRVTVDAGGKTLTGSRDAAFGHGYLEGAEDVRFIRLSEEHGVLHADNGAERFKVGQRVRIVPIHVCVWMDLQAEIYGTRGGEIVERITIDAMRHSL